MYACMLQWLTRVSAWVTYWSVAPWAYGGVPLESLVFDCCSHLATSDALRHGKGFIQSCKGVITGNKCTSEQSSLGFVHTPPGGEMEVSGTPRDFPAFHSNSDNVDQTLPLRLSDYSLFQYIFLCIEIRATFVRNNIKKTTETVFLMMTCLPRNRLTATYWLDTPMYAY
jgi:hypothetical protein